MLIQDVVDLNQWPYVCPKSTFVETFKGPLSLPRAFLSDGASGFLVRDLEIDGFFSHDRLYVSPFIGIKRVNKVQADLIYAHILLKHWRVLEGVFRPIILVTWPGSWSTWRKYRLKDEQDPQWWCRSLSKGGRFVDHRDNWVFPTYETQHAFWDPHLP